MSKSLTYKVLGLDPSASCTGLALLDIDISKQEITNINTKAIYPKEIYRHKYFANGVNITGPDFSNLRIDLVIGALDDYLTNNRPNIIYSEKPHIDTLHLNNVYLLNKLKVKIEDLIRKHGIKHYQMLSTTAKKIIGANTRKGREKMTAKDRVLDSMSRVEPVTKLININNITPDEIDAILIAYAGHYGSAEFLTEV